ncbi:MAG: hypothetical protein RL761_1123 [Pseudomonadota bacterium]|jgi:hypothetical protein
MKNYTKLASISLAWACILCTTVFAQSAPGEDPINLTKVAKLDARPTAPQQLSGSLDPLFGMQGWLKARVTRYEARAYSDNASDTIVTENDAVTTASAQGLKKVCVQEVGSTSSSATSFGKYGPKGAAQIVVLKGDLVNICK